MLMLIIIDNTYDYDYDYDTANLVVKPTNKNYANTSNLSIYYNYDYD